MYFGERGKIMQKVNESLSVPGADETQDIFTKGFKR